MDNDKLIIPTRICRLCGQTISYARKDSFIRADRENRACFNCSTGRGATYYRFGKHLTKEVKEKISKTKSGLPVHSEETKRKLSERWKKDNPVFKPGRKFAKHNEISKQKLRDANLAKNWMRGRTGGKHPFFGKKHTEEGMANIRKGVAKAAMIRKDFSSPNYNRKSIDFFFKIEQKNNFDGFFATKNREFYLSDLGYWVDYYEPKLNLVIEYDEPHHFKAGQLKDWDIQRMERIKNKLKCYFYRYDVRKNILIDYSCEGLRKIEIVL